MAFEALKGWTPTAKHTVMASYLAWTFDAYDFFLLTFVFPDTTLFRSIIANGGGTE